MENVNYTELNFHRNGLELAKPKDITCRIMCGQNSAKRGDIVTFSTKSANRLRKVLLDIDFNNSFALCLTLPKVDNLEYDFSGLWHNFCVLHQTKCSDPFVWRVELQTRGVPHWHLVYCGGYYQALNFKHLWQDFISKRFRCSLPFFLHSVKIQPVHESSSALMYLTAHMSKHKSSQLGWHGRQWGIVNRKYLRLLPSISTVQINEHDMIQIVRQFRRLAFHLDKEGVYTGAFGRSRFRRFIFGTDEYRFRRIWEYFTLKGSCSPSEKNKNTPLTNTPQI